jgi:hypothetical protein
MSSANTARKFDVKAYLRKYAPGKKNGCPNVATLEFVR